MADVAATAVGGTPKSEVSIVLARSTTASPESRWSGSGDRQHHRRVGSQGGACARCYWLDVELESWLHHCGQVAARKGTSDDTSWRMFRWVWECW